MISQEVGWGYRKSFHVKCGGSKSGWYNLLFMTFDQIFDLDYLIGTEKLVSNTVLPIIRNENLEIPSKVEISSADPRSEAHSLYGHLNR